MVSDSLQSYQESSVTTVEPVKLVTLLYDGALRFIHRARRAVAAKNPEDAHNNILRAYAVIAELMATLDHDKGGDIAAKLDQCYEYVLHELKEADIQKADGPLLNALRVIGPLAETWQQAFGGKPGEAPRVPLLEIGDGNGSAEAPEAPSSEGPAQADAAPRQDAKQRKALDVVG